MSADKREPPGGDKVGYGRPPKHTQFKKGRSGNPGGRPKSRGSGTVDVAGILDQPIKVKRAGKVYEMSSFEASFRQIARKALDKDLPAIIAVIKACEEYGVICKLPIAQHGGVIRAPEGVDFQEWVDSVTELVPDER